MKPIELAVSALHDLEDIRIWYVDHQVPHIGERLIRELSAKTEQLAEFPESGRVVPEFGVPTVRELIHPPYRLVYRNDPDTIWIVRVWRSERLLGFVG